MVFQSLDISVLTCLILTRVIFASVVTPVLIWNEKASDNAIVSVSALQQIPYDVFKEKYLSLFQSENILLFLQDTLSVEDLSLHSSQLSHVNKWIDDLESLYLPSVEDPSQLLQDLSKQGYNVVTLDVGSAIAELNLKQESKNLVIVRLPATVENLHRSDALRKSDEVMWNVVSKIGQLRPFTFIFTAVKPSVDLNEVDHIRVSRSLQAVSRNDVGFHNSSCVMLFVFKNFTFNFISSGSDGSTETVVIDESHASGEDTSDCQGSSTSILVKYVNVPFNNPNSPLPKLSIQIHSKGTKKSNYQIHFVQVNVETKTYDFFPFKTSDAQGGGTPSYFSYVCSVPQIFTANVTDDKGRKMQMVINGIQYQPYTSGKTSFSTSYDCVGFFSVPIWCGLLASLLCVIIMLWGLYMLADVKTMDRFDDPKGKTIIIPNTD